MMVQVLVSTMNQEKGDYSLIDRMNIKTDAIIVNQCDYNYICDFDHNGNSIKWISIYERGVGLSRNTALMRADADIVIMADDDVVYEDDYETKICKFYETHSDADVVIFNVKERRGKETTFVEGVSVSKKIKYRKATEYGTSCFSFKNAKVKSNNINFHREFGGGARFSCGEDSLFMKDCFRKKLSVYTCADLIATLDHGESTWFKGYNTKFFYDIGAVYYMLNPALCYGFALYHCVKHRDLYREYGWTRAYKMMKKGCRERRKEL